MKRIFCKHCDAPITLSKERLLKARTQEEGRLSVVCPSCHREMRLVLRSTRADERGGGRRETPPPFCGRLVVVENSFGYKQHFLLQKGANGIGRRNKDTQTTIPIITADPSMDRHHAGIFADCEEAGVPRAYLMDDDSMVGTFLKGRELEKKERVLLHSGDVFTLGATSVIYSDTPLEDEEPTEVELKGMNK